MSESRCSTIVHVDPLTLGANVVYFCSPWNSFCPRTCRLPFRRARVSPRESCKHVLGSMLRLVANAIATLVISSFAVITVIPTAHMTIAILAA